MTKRAKVEGKSSLSGVMCGTGEYTTGFVHNKASTSDKKIGVVGLCLFELRRIGKVDKLGMVGTTGTKFPAIRKHLQDNISKVYNDLDVSCATYPSDDVAKDYTAYKEALNTLSPGDFAVIFTPDDTHFEIAMYAIERGLHVLITKPAVKTLKEHRELVKAAEKKNVLVYIEFHKRYDPMYFDFFQRAKSLGDFGYFSSYMSQPQSQLDTFKAWAGKSSDISYYLNSHHIDVHCHAVQGWARPMHITAMGSTGVANSEPYNCAAETEDTITLLVEWENVESKNKGVAVYTSSWVSPNNGEVHSQQKFYYQGHKGDVKADQAHRGYEVKMNNGGLKFINPLYMTYVKDYEGNYAGHDGYGFKSFSKFIDACHAINAGKMDTNPEHLPTLQHTTYVTAILEAGRISLDNNSKRVSLKYNDASPFEIGSLELN